MSTLAEIEEAVASLSPDEREMLERRLHAMNMERAGCGTIFAGSDAVQWWPEMEHLPATEAEAFAEDVEAARRELNRPPTAMGVVVDSSIFIKAERGRHGGEELLNLANSRIEVPVLSRSPRCCV